MCLLLQNGACGSSKVNIGSSKVNIGSSKVNIGSSKVTTPPKSRDSGGPANSACVPLCYKNLCCASRFCTGWGLGGSD